MGPPEAWALGVIHLEGKVRRRPYSLSLIERETAGDAVSASDVLLRTNKIGLKYCGASVSHIIIDYPPPPHTHTNNKDDFDWIPCRYGGLAHNSTS